MIMTGRDRRSSAWGWQWGVVPDAVRRCMIPKYKHGKGKPIVRCNWECMRQIV